jgi:hypothetical protein
VLMASRIRSAVAVTGGIHHTVGAGANGVAEGGQKLEKNSGGMRLGVRGHGAYGQPGDAVKGGFAEFELGERRGRWPCEGLAGLQLGLNVEEFGRAALYVRQGRCDWPGYPGDGTRYHNLMLLRFRIGATAISYLGLLERIASPIYE